MDVTVRAGFFEVDTPQDTVAEIQRLCATLARSRTPGALEVQHEGKTYGLANAKWDSGDDCLSGTIFRVRDRRLPSKLKGAVVQALNISADENLGEPASFAYSPRRKLALVEYNHNGPRHCALRAFLYHAGLSGPVNVTQRLRQDAAARLKKAKLVRKIEFGFTSAAINELAAVREAGGAIADTLDAMADVEGFSIHVTISMGREPGGLGEKARRILEALQNGGTSISTLKAGIKETDEHLTDLIDFLGSSDTVEFTCTEAGRELNHAECRRKLVFALKKHAAK